ncbi:MAG: Ig-like domain-containing protein [Vulcanimicrobiota bacterium]
MRKWFVLAVASVTAFGCGSSQVQDFLVNNPGANPTGLSISPKPVNKRIGQTQQFIATASFDNGSTADVTGLVQWSSSNPAVVTIGASTGLATAVSQGQATITARSGSFTDTAPMTVASGTELVTLDSAGVQGNSGSLDPSTSADGRFVTFTSASNNLVAGDSNSTNDIFVRDRQTGVTTRVSVDSAGGQANGPSFLSHISDDGRFVSFESTASNLVAGDSNGASDVFVHDRQTGTTTRVSVGPMAQQANDAAFQSSISPDGRFVGFASTATNLVTGDTNGTTDVFVHDRQTGTTTRVSVNSAGVEGNNSSFQPPSFSADGRFVAYLSGATNLVANDTNGLQDLFLHDRQTATTTRISVGAGGLQANGTSFGPRVSADGRFVAFTSSATNLVAGDSNGRDDVFVHDRQTGTTTRVSLDSAGVQGDLDSGFPSLSADGRFVAFHSSATNLVPGDSNGQQDIFVHDRQNATTTRVGLGVAGAQGNGASSTPWISANGLVVAFRSDASNLVPVDANGTVADIFVTDR